MNCYRYSGISSVAFRACTKNLEALLESRFVLLWGDYMVLMLVVVIVGLLTYQRTRKSRWHRLCDNYLGLKNNNGLDKNGKQRFRYANLRSHRRYWLFGELLGVYIYGLDTVTVGTVKNARESIEKYMGTLFSDPVDILSGIHKGKVYLPVNGLVAKKKPER